MQTKTKTIANILLKIMLFVAIVYAENIESLLLNFVIDISVARASALHWTNPWYRPQQSALAHVGDIGQCVTLSSVVAVLQLNWLNWLSM